MGILGTGSISAWWLASVRRSPHIEVLSVASRSPQRARAFAERERLPRSHESYGVLIDDPGIDAVYVALRNGDHAQWSIAAANAGKHVLCEKPLAQNLDEARTMFAAARTNDVVLQEAFAYRFTEQASVLAKLVRNGSIGRPVLVRTNTSYVRRYHPDENDSGAGALMDSGCYAVGIARLVMGRAPHRVHSIGSFVGGRDETLVGTFDYADGSFGQISCSCIATDAPQTQIVGTDGVIETGFVNASWRGKPLIIRHKRGRDAAVAMDQLSVAGTDGYLAETEALRSRVFREPFEWPGMTEAESLDGAATLDALQQSARSGLWVNVAAAPA